MKKFECFIRSSRTKKWSFGMIVITANIREAANIAASQFPNKWIKVLPAITIL